MKVIKGFCVVGSVVFGTLFSTQMVSALTYQNTIGVKFTFEPVLNVSLSSDELLIDGLAPGNTAYSNTITISVNTTSVSGYTLSAAVGDGTSYTDNNLTNLAVPSTPKPTFASIPTNTSAITTFTTDNTWGYSLDATNYYGLDYIYSVNNQEETWTVINATKDLAGTAALSGCVGTCPGTANTTFKIGAKASVSQASGDYTNIIQFKVVSNPVPSTYSIAYNKNTTDAVTGMPADISVTNTDGGTITLPSTAPTRSGYYFMGWCTKPVSESAACLGELYQAGEAVPLIGGQYNDFSLYAVWSDTQPLDSSLATSYSIIYAPNSGDIVGSMSSLGEVSGASQAGKQTKAIPSTSSTTLIKHSNMVELIAPNYARPGYGFAGWSTDFIIDNDSIIYGPNEYISTKTSDGGLDLSGGLILYPVWLASSGNLQNWTGCSSLKPVSYDVDSEKIIADFSSITALTDTRDGNVYTIARLADGLCWIVENLRLNAENSRNPEKIAMSQGYGLSATHGDFIGLADSEDANFSNSTTANTLYSTNGSNNTINIGTSNYPAYRIPRYNNNNTNINISATNSDGVTMLVDGYDTDNNHSRWYSYGNYYNWAAAMANTAYYDTYSGSSGSDAAGTSICPSGWHLPLGAASTGTLVDGASDPANSVGGFSYLDRIMGGTGGIQTTQTDVTRKWRIFPNNFVYSGYWKDNRAYDRGGYGHYWSSSGKNYVDSYYFMFNFSKLYVAGSYYKSEGRAVRCVLGP